MIYLYGLVKHFLLNIKLVFLKKSINKVIKMFYNIIKHILLYYLTKKEW